METKTETLADLLKQWSELEPERCWEDTNERGHKHFVLPMSSGTQWIIGKNVDDLPNRFVFQGLVQEAIEARDWYLSLRMHQQNEIDFMMDGCAYRWHAWVTSDLALPLSPEGKSFRDDATTALLDAYLQTIRKVHDE